jgi:DNA invertase Pin-like site-specific DNA recombinase
VTTVTRREVMDALLIGYARVSTDEQDLTAQRDALAALGVSGERIYVDQGLTGTNRERPGLRQALAACRAGDTLVVTKLDRLARSLPDARAIVEDLTPRQVKLSLGGAAHDGTDPVGRLLFNVLAMVAEFEGDLIRLRTREGMRVAKAKGRLRGKQPKPNVRQEAHLVALHRAGEHSVTELGDLFGITRSTVLPSHPARRRTAAHCAARALLPGRRRVIGVPNGDPVAGQRLRTAISRGAECVKRDWDRASSSPGPGLVSLTQGQSLDVPVSALLLAGSGVGQ